MAEFVNLNGYDMCFEIHGAGIPMVYTPGGFFTLEKGRVVAEKLGPLGYKVLLWDRPNTGASGLLFEGDNLLQIWADKLHALLHYTGLSPAFVAGGSGGGLGLLYFAYVYPTDVQGLILIAPPTDDPDLWENMQKGTFLDRAEAADQQGMAAALEPSGGMWDLFNWSEQFERMPQKRQQLLSMSPHVFAETMRTWARSMTAGGRPALAGLRDDQLATINIATIVFSGPDAYHPRHAAEALHARLPQSTLVLSDEYYAETWGQMLREIEEKGGEHFDASLAGRIDEFVRSVL